MSAARDDSTTAKAENLRGYRCVALESGAAAHYLDGGRGGTLGRPFDPGTSEPVHRASFSFEGVRCIDLPARVPPALAFPAAREQYNPRSVAQSGNRIHDRIPGRW